MATEIEAPLSPKPKVSKTAQRRRMSPMGASWRRGLYPQDMAMPEPTITAMLYFEEEAPSLDVLADTFEQKVWPRFKFSSIVEGSEFVKLEGRMDRSYHFKQVEMESEQDIEAYCFANASKPLDPAWPLWHLEVLRPKTGRQVVCLKIHHCLTDGLGLLFAFLPMLTLEDGGNILEQIPLPASMTGVVKRNSELKSMPKTDTPEMQLGCCKRRCRNTGLFFKGACSLLTMPMDSDLKINPKAAERTPFLKYSGRHQFTKMPSVPTEEVKKVRSVHGCSFNDAIMAALTGAFRRYSIETCNDPLLQGTKPVECKTFMLIALPRPVSEKEPDKALANNFLVPAFKLSIDEKTPVERLRATVDTTNILKSSAYISGIWALTRFFTAILPAGFMQKTTSKAISKISCNITSVPLPEVQMSFTGKPVSEVQCIFLNNVPQISLLSYNGEVQWSMVSDPALISDPAAFGRYFKEEIEALGRRDSSSTD